MLTLKHKCYPMVAMSHIEQGKTLLQASEH